VEDGYARLNVPVDFRPYAEPRVNTPTGKIQLVAPELARLGLDAVPSYIPRRRARTRTRSAPRAFP
jgi:hypothetical protein